jgi:predicted NAD/FAD-dependent oxidoreductase
MSDETFVIVGASLAGAKAAEELRERGFDGRLGRLRATRWRHSAALTGRNRRSSRRRKSRPNTSSANSSVSRTSRRRM